MKTLTLLLAGLTSTAAFAENFDNRWYFSPMAQYINVDNERELNDDGYGLQLHFGKPVSDHLNVEVGVFGARLDSDDDTNQDADLEQYGLNLDLLAFSDRNGIQPYVLAGVGTILSKLDSDVDSNSEQGLHADIGLGALWPVTDNGFAIRGEARLRTEFNDDLVEDESRFQDLIISLGVVAPIGQKPANQADDDRDGVTNNADLCPNSPAGAVVNTKGCPLDSDGDGVADGLDKCPASPRGSSVNAEGCPADDDKDGVANDADQCPTTAPGTRVDSLGCDLSNIITLDGVQFRTNSAELLAVSEAILNDAAGTLLRYSRLNVEVAGHTDSRGSSRYNQNLSQRRAQSVMRYLIDAGVDAGRLTAQGYGEDDPVDSNHSNAGRANNRRVELRVQN